MKSIVCSVQVKAAAPGLHDNTGDLDRLQQALISTLADGRPLAVPYPRMTPVARKFRAAAFAGYALLNNLDQGWVVVDFFEDMPAVIPAMALDLGTTHLEATLLDLQNGEALAEGNLENEQITFGADILSRIHHATTARRQKKSLDADFQDHGLVELQQVIISCINELAEILASRAGIKVSEIRALSVSGNTTMAHLFLGLDPYHICREPYIPLFNRAPVMDAGQLKLAINPASPVWIMPSVGSYFGGDLVSGILASGMAQSDKTRMLIDVGTNAEVVLGNSEWLIACAGAAGPALEGGVARMGMRAGPGAIEFVSINTETYEMEYRTIGNARPKGLCGSGLIDLVAALYLTRMIDIRGKFRDPASEQDPARAAFMKKHLRKRDDGLCFFVTGTDVADSHDEVVLEQIDLDAMIRSKAAMYAILTTLINQVGLEFSELEEITVAGAFGRHINPHHAMTLGMLPDLPLSKYRAIGNSSLRGAEKVLLDDAARRDCERIVSSITYLELNVNQEFMIRFSGARFIPHTDPSLFPSVPLFDLATS
ncbi:MAG: ASKHA domain-containing protein [Thermodesulfobacteriota bacterium]|nr:ASKHA domain-containing protein [Thermodesulfobacteriota bacterium]